MTLGGRPILRDVSWQLRPGEHWAIAGPNGSGKSTFLRLIRGDQWPDPRSGLRTYRFGGRTTHHAVGVREQIGLVSPEQQERYLRLDFGISGRTAIETGFFNTDYLYAAPSPEQRARVQALVALLGIEELAERDVARLSQGELRKVLIARALVHEPAVLLLDEVASGLDRAARRALREVLERVATRTQTVLVTHRPAERLRATTHELRLQGGRIVSSGPFVRTGVRVAPIRPTPLAPRRAPAVAGDFLVRIERADVYLEGRHVLFGIDWTIRPGEHWAILGPNGSGKSTLAKLAAGLIHPAFGGNVRHFGAKRPTHLWELKRRIAFLSDEAQTAYDQDIPARAVVASGFFSSVGLYGRLEPEQERAVDALLARFGLEGFAQRPFLRLSFGERRKILIARALVRTPEIAIVDEATSGLDEPFRAAFLTLLEELARGGTTLVVMSHHEDDVPPVVTDELWMERGRIVRLAQAQGERSP